jgi:transposase-like protein
VKQRPAKSTGLRRHRTSQERTRILKEHERSGLSLLAFARMHGLCYASLRRWRRWRSRPRPQSRVLTPPAPEVDPRFVPVTVETEVVGGDYVLNLAGGRSLRIPLRFEPDSLRRLLTVLEGVQ